MKRAILSLFLALVLFGGCRTTTETVYVDRFKDREVLRVDSVIVNNTDSVLIFQKGDTIYNTTVRIRYRDKVKIERDTIRETFETVITKTEVKEVKIRDPFWWLGVSGWLAFIVWLFFKIKKAFKLQ
jgi:hypothetical protein